VIRRLVVVAVMGLLVAAMSCGDEEPKRDNTLNHGIVFLPQVQVRPPNVPAGAEVEVYGGGFALRAALRGYIAGPGTNELRTAFADATTDSDGSFRINVKLGPGISPGRYRVTFTNADSSSMNGETTLIVLP
jgi:hypothetical protein